MVMTVDCRSANTSSILVHSAKLSSVKMHGLLVFLAIKSRCDSYLSRIRELIVMVACALWRGVVEVQILHSRPLLKF